MYDLLQPSIQMDGSINLSIWDMSWARNKRHALGAAVSVSFGGILHREIRNDCRLHSSYPRFVTPPCAHAFLVQVPPPLPPLPTWDPRVPIPPRSHTVPDRMNACMAFLSPDHGSGVPDHTSHRCRVSYRVSCRVLSGALGVRSWELTSALAKP